MAVKKMWGGRFSEKNSDVTERLSMSVHYDSRLYRHDIRGSKAHAEMLCNMGILTQEELDAVLKGLSEIEIEIESGEFEFHSEYEDIHMNIEARLTEKIGDAGKKLHTARSRNDQIAVDTRLYIREEVGKVEGLLKQFIIRLTEHAEEQKDTVLAGYTHMQIAQPVRLSHHLLAHAWALVRDLNRFKTFRETHNLCPLGVGALAGVNYKNDRQFLAQKLGFAGITPNSMDTVADRDYIADVLYASSLLGVHLSRMCEELVLWSSYEFNYITLSDTVTTGSSIMPQKKNPDLAELIRGKSGRLTGNLVSLLTVMKGLPLTYNRDMQEDKEPLFDSMDTVHLSLEGMIAMFDEIVFNKERMSQTLGANFSTATDVADYLASRGVPFRTSHEIVGSLVGYCEKEKCNFYSLTLDELKKFSLVFEEDVLEYLNPAGSTERKLSEGSTSVEQVMKQISSIREIVE
ncbi:MAG: argininosuccinate lyase [Spirochaetes bacterium]|jgi:argininosuccinate lyase|nr:argininosuccinate lyase [Spirochaetota bacterium]